MESHNSIKKVKNKMNGRDKTKDELIKELQKLQQEYDLLEASYENNITDRKLAEEALKESERVKSELFEKMNAAQHIAMLGSWEWNLKTNQVSWSDETYRIFGVTPQNFVPSFEANGKFIHPDDVERYSKSFEHSIQTGEPLDVDLRLVTNDGLLKHCNGKGKIFYNDSGQPIRFIGTLMDITERKHAEETLRNSEAFLNNIIDQSPVPMWISDDKGILIRINKACCSLLKITEQDVIGKYNVIEDNIVQEQGLLSDVRRVFDNGETVRFEIRYNTSKLEGFSLESEAEAIIDTTIFPIKDYKGKVTNAVIQHIDITERKLAEKTLQEREARYKTLIENIPQKIFMKDRDYRFMSINENFARDIGISPEEIVGKLDRDLFSNELADKYHAADVRIITTGKTEELEEKYVVDGKETWVNTIKTPVRDDKGEIVGLLGIFWDITGRKRIEEDLRESENKFKYVFDNSVIGKSITLPTGEINVNKAFCEMLGYTSEELTKTKWQNISHPDDIEPTNKALSLLIAGEKDSVRFIKRYFHKNGSMVWADVSTSLRRDADNKPLYFITSVNDITERKMAEEALKNSEHHNKVIAGMTTDYVFIVDVDSQHNLTLRWTSENLDQVTGRTISDDATADLWKKIIHPEDTGYFFKFIEQILTTAESGEIECRSITKFGTERWIHVFARPETDENSRIIAIIGAVKDITERKIAESEIRKLNEELEQRVTQRTAQLEAVNKELEAFSYSVSHDLRAPLRAIHGYSKILLEDYEDKLDDEGKRVCNIISSSAIQMGGLIDDLLSFSRVGRSSLNAGAINMNFLAASVFTDISNEMEKARTNLKIGKLHRAYGDQSLIKQVWNNLISNALKYSSKQKTPEISIGSRKEGEMITYFVKDNGVGFDMQYSNKLFGVFQRLHSISEFEGNGVGLAIVRRIISKHGGKAWAEGEVGKGATFYFSLPVIGTGS